MSTNTITGRQEMIIRENPFQYPHSGRFFCRADGGRRFYSDTPSFCPHHTPGTHGPSLRIASLAKGRSPLPVRLCSSWTLWSSRFCRRRRHFICPFPHIRISCRADSGGMGHRKYSQKERNLPDEPVNCVNSRNRHHIFRRRFSPVFEPQLPREKFNPDRPDTANRHIPFHFSRPSESGSSFTPYSEDKKTFEKLAVKD